jgi:hypothetical protein
VDLDFVLCEYDEGQPYAIIEYKAELARPVHLAHPTMRALRNLSDRARLPFLLTTYATDYTLYRVQSLNYYATHHEAVHDQMEFSEQQYIDFLLRLRGRLPNGELFR